MSFRVGNQGHEMWPECLRLSVAAIAQETLATTDLARFAPGEPKELWKPLSASQKYSLRCVAYEMRPGDVIYVKQGPKIIDRGTVTGAYRFDSQYRMVDPNGVPWTHQVPVAWSQEFEEVNVLLRAEQFTVLELRADDVARIEGSAGPRTDEAPSPASGAEQRGAASLLEDSYYRESPARLKTIVRRHNRLSNEFCGWLQNVHGVGAV